MEGKPKQQEIIEQKYLKEGVRPIVACIGTMEDFNEQKEFKNKHESLATNVSWYAALNKGKSHAISEIDQTDKYSEGYQACTGIVATGIEKESGDNISMLTHEVVGSVLDADCSVSFFSDLNTKLQELKGKCEEGTIDAVIFGGIYNESVSMNDDGREEYVKSIKFLSDNISDKLGFQPEVIVGPKTFNKEKGYIGWDSVWYDTNERRLYIMRPGMSQSAKSFSPNEIEEERKKWEQSS